jgi:uncharacterized protein (DUF1015 family)
VEQPLFKPFRALRPSPDHAAGVLAPPYDVLNTEEARLRAAGKPDSFLHISKPEIDLPQGTDPFAAEVYQTGADNLRRLISAQVLVRDSEPCYYVYQLRMQDHLQTGVAGVGSVAGYRENRIRKHELTRPAKEDDRVRQITTLAAQTGPVLLAYRAQADIKDQLAAITSQSPPLYDLAADDGVTHRIWPVSDPHSIAHLTAAFDGMAALYIADGHHRSAAASRAWEEFPTTDAELSDYFLSVAFPHDEMRILDYNRVIADLNGLTPSALLTALRADFEVTALEGARKPTRPQQFSLYLDGSWYSLRLPIERVPADPVGRLDVSLLQNHLVAPILDIMDQRRDPRIDFVGGIRGLEELERRVDAQGTGLALALFPTSMVDLMAVADANELMPPKSTWFEPKLADGLLSHVIGPLGAATTAAR